MILSTLTWVSSKSGQASPALKIWLSRPPMGIPSYLQLTQESNLPNTETKPRTVPSLMGT